MFVFSGRWGKDIAKSFLGNKEFEKGSVEFSKFKNNEQRVIVKSEVDGEVCVVVQSIVSQPDEALVELLFLVNSLKESGARRVEVVIPFMGYSLQNRYLEGEPISAKVVAKVISGVQPSRVLIGDLHEEHILDFFTVPVLEVKSEELMYKSFKDREIDLVVACDDGARKKAQILAKKFGVEYLVVKKRRDEKTTEIKEISLSDNVNFEGKRVLIADDIVNTGGTIERVGRELKDKGVGKSFLAVTHFLAVGGSFEKLEKVIDEMVVTDSVGHKLSEEKKVEVVSYGGEFLRFFS